MRLFKLMYKELGENYQLTQVLEELAEAQQAICKYKKHVEKLQLLGKSDVNVYETIDNMAEELADVQLTTDGLIYHLGIKDKVNKIYKQKEERTYNRIIKFINDK